MQVFYIANQAKVNIGPMTIAFLLASYATVCSWFEKVSYIKTQTLQIHTLS